MDGSFDVGAAVVKVNATLAGMQRGDVGVAAPTTSGMMAAIIGNAFWNYYSAKAGENVACWIGGNVLKNYRLTLDYPNRMSYWLQQSPPDAHELDQVGITLVHFGSHTGVAAIVNKNGAPAVNGVMPGDEIVSIDGIPTAAMTHGELLNALHGAPGERKHLTLKRNGQQIEVDAAVTSF